jgi:hypoxia up-regulated 1
MNAQDTARKNREEALNSLEAFIYSSKDFLSLDDVEAVTTENQRESFRAKVEEIGDWMDENSSDSTTEEIRKKLAILKEIKAPISFRRDEKTTIDEAVKKLEESATNWVVLLESLKKNNTDVESPSYELSDLDSGIRRAKEVTEWLKTQQEAQSKLKPHVTFIYAPINQF